MGQKIHPFGFRLGVTQKHYARWFANPDKYPQYVLEDYLIRKSLYKLLPPENLPKKMEDGGEMRVVHIKIERFLRNTIQIKIYAVNPGVFTSTNRKTKKSQNTSFKNKSSQNRNKFSQNKNSASLDKKRENREQTKEKSKVLDLVSKYNRFVTKRVQSLNLLKLQNIIYRFEILKQLSNLNNNATVVLNQNENTKSPDEILKEIRGLSTKISLLNFYLNKRLSENTNNSTSVLTKAGLEKTIVFINQNLLKARLTFKIYKLQTQLLKHFPKLTQSVMKNFLTNEITKKSEMILGELLKHADNSNTSKSLFESKLPSTIRLRHNLQQILNKNYSRNFASFLSRRRTFNFYLGKFGQKRVNPSTLTPQEILDKTSENFENDALNLKQVDLLQTEKKLSLRRNKDSLVNRNSLTTEQTTNNQNRQLEQIRRLKAKRIQKNLITLSIRNRFDKVSNLRKVYNTENLNNLCEEMSKIQTFPKISSIEFISVQTPTLYAVSLANFIVEKLQKRFSFRGTMKKAKEEAMKTPGIKGIKIQVAGRLNGAEIARTEWMRAGRVPLQTLKAKIDYSYKTASTIYGILGVKVWIFKEKQIQN